MPVHIDVCSLDVVSLQMMRILGWASIGFLIGSWLFVIVVDTHNLTIEIFYNVGRKVLDLFLKYHQVKSIKLLEFSNVFANLNTLIIIYLDFFIYNQIPVIYFFSFQLFKFLI